MDRFGICRAFALIAGSIAGVNAGLDTAPAVAAEVFKCDDVHGQVIFQDHACAAGQRGARVELQHAPAFAPSPDYGIAKSSHANTRGGERHAVARSAARGGDTQSFECRAENGEVFYKHSTCPKSIRTASSGRRGEKAASVSVSSVAMSRGDVCQRMQRSVGRSGRSRDDDVSTYERNEGRDPCRNY